MCVLFVNNSFSQVGIGTETPDSSSQLDISATDKGILIPRINIADLNTASPITNPQVSLLVYSNNVTNTGFYYWNGSVWTPVGSSAKRFAEITKTNASTLVVGNQIIFDNTSYEQGVTAYTDKFTAQINGLYKVSYTVSVKNTHPNNVAAVDFYLTIGWFGAVPGSYTFVNLRPLERETVSMTKLVTLTAGEELLIRNVNAVNGGNISILGGGTMFTIEFIQP
jgi:hypothetical protein